MEVSVKSRLFTLRVGYLPLRVLTFKTLPLRVGYLPYAVGKQPSKPLIYRGKNGRRDDDDDDDLSQRGIRPKNLFQHRS